MSVFEEYLAKYPLPDNLYHYTNGNAILGIAKNKELWASHILYLNDRTEFNFTFEKIRNKKKIKDKRNIVKFLFDDIEKEDVYVLSFSSEKDKLNMWKKYTDMNPGYCVSFNSSLLPDNTDDYKIQIGRVTYNDKEQKEFLKAIEKEVKNTTNDESSYYFEYYEKLLEVAPFIKNDSFKDENEWRITIKTKRKNIEIREGKSAFTPYYPLKINLDVINGILFGPCGNKEFIEESIYFLCGKYFKNINLSNIKGSDIPFR